jgi:hypothetical protein
MTRARRGAIAVALLAIIAAALSFAVIRRTPAPVPARPAQRQAVMLLTSLPLMFSEDFSLSGGSPALNALKTRYRVVPISVTSPAELAKGRLLLMAQPLSQTPENLVALDQWVRRGGRVLLFADPLLEWPSRRPLGDSLRPPPMFADTGLLAHWGLRLDAPDERGVTRRTLGGYRILTVSPGVLYGDCAISQDRLLADCRIGNGRAVVLADADLLDVANLGPEAKNNLRAMAAELASLASR